MASATEIGRVVQHPGYEVDAHILVRPPLETSFGNHEDNLCSAIARLVFDDPGTKDRTVGLHEMARLGDLSQIIRLRTFDASSGNPEESCDKAVSALQTYVVAMAEGNIEALQLFLPLPEK
jgi:hypothetical protein